MAGKYQKKKKRKNTGLKLALCILSCILVVMLVFLIRMERQEPETVPEETTGEVTPLPGTQSQETTPVIQEGQTPVETEPNFLFDLGSGVVITDYISYTGAYMEDRTDEFVSDVLAIRVTNTGEEFIQTMDITLDAGDVQGSFSLSTLFPGQTVIVLEKNRMPFQDAVEFTDARTGSVALFQTQPEMCEDLIEIQCLNGVMNITNISGADITGDILIYYKNYVSGIFYGGITYRIRIEGGLKDGEIRQGSAAHFNPDNSTVVFVTCG